MLEAIQGSHIVENLVIGNSGLTIRTKKPFFKLEVSNCCQVHVNSIWVMGVMAILPFLNLVTDNIILSDTS